MIPLPGINKSGDESWGRGYDVYIDPTQVVSIEPRQHCYHSFRPKQDYCTVTLSTGTSVDVWLTADEAYELVEKATAVEGAKGF